MNYPSLVIMRKATFGNRLGSGTFNQAALMSVMQTGILNSIELLDICQTLSLKPLASFVESSEARAV